MDEAVTSILGKITHPDTPNKLDLPSIKNWLSKYLFTRQEEVKQFPDLADEAHWDVLIADFSYTYPSVFLIVIFTGETVAFTAGHGEKSALRVFVDTDFPEDVREIIPEMRAQFTLSETLEMGRADLLQWLETWSSYQ